MAGFRDYWIVTIVIAIILLLAAIIWYWLSTSNDVSAWIWALLAISFILVIVSFILFAVRSSFEKKYVIQSTLMVEPTWSDDSCSTQYSDYVIEQCDSSPKYNIAQAKTYACSTKQISTYSDCQPCGTTRLTECVEIPPPSAPPCDPPCAPVCPPPTVIEIQPPVPPPVYVEVAPPAPSPVVVLPTPAPPVCTSSVVIEETPCENTTLEITKPKCSIPIKPKSTCPQIAIPAAGGEDSLYPSWYKR